MAKIMVVDDEKDIRISLKNLLEAQGYQVIMAEDGDQYLQLVKKEKPDLVMLDILMVRKDGVQTLKELMQANPKEKVIMVTVVGQEQVIKEAMKAGASDYILKPFDFENILETVKRVLKTENFDNW